MKIRQNLCKLLIAFLLVMGLNTVKAVEVVDVDADYWAAREISQALVKGYMTLNDKDEFVPNGYIKRTDFIAALMKVLKSDNIQTLSQRKLTDLDNNTRNLKSVVIAEQLGIIFGYPDGTFKPEEPITRAEASSALGHITRGSYDNLRILAQFNDYDRIPNWAVMPYAKAVKNALYINYPDKSMLRPNDKLTRAEAAVLFKKVENSIELIDTKYKADFVIDDGEDEDIAEEPVKIEDILISTQTLDIHPQALSNAVEIYNTKVVIKAGNIIKARFVTPVNYKTAKIGDIVEFVAPEDVVTTEGTHVYSAGTKFSSEILKIKASPWLGKNDKMLLVLDRIMLNDGYHFLMAGVPLTKFNNDIVYTKERRPFWMKNKDKKKEEIEFLIKYSYRLSPRVKYNNDEGDEIYILLNDDLIFRNRDL